MLDLLEQVKSDDIIKLKANCDIKKESFENHGISICNQKYYLKLPKLLSYNMLFSDIARYEDESKKIEDLEYWITKISRWKILENSMQVEELISKNKILIVGFFSFRDQNLENFLKVTLFHHFDGIQVR